MAILLKATVFIFVVILAWVMLRPAPKPPVLDPEEWWGPEEMKGKTDDSIRPFEIKFNATMIKDLKERLKRRRPFAPPLEGIAFEYGFNTKQLESYLNYWANDYPFAQREKFLNQLPQFKTNIQGMDIHFVRVKPKVTSGVTVLPILLIHGWPGSVREFFEAIPILNSHRPGYDFVFEVIVPSIPGFGFSDGPIRPGLDQAEIAVVYRNLMHRLGFKKYYIQGGNWGSAITAAMITFYPEEILGHHSNGAIVNSAGANLKMILGSFMPSLITESHLVDRIYPLSWLFSFMLQEFGYCNLHATKPDTIGKGLTDSPSGLAAYVLEKFSTWTNRDHRFQQDGGLSTYNKDQLIDNLMFYWVPNSLNTAIRLYANGFAKKYMELALDTYPSDVPTWIMQAKHELFYQPPSILNMKYTNVLNYSVLDHGGHFFALELPEEFADDIFKAVKAFREWRRVNKAEL